MPATLDQLKQALVAADKAGNQDDARRIAAAIGRMQQEQQQQYQEEPEQLSFTGGIKEAVTGEKRSTETIEALPDWATMPEMNEASMASFKAALGTMLTGPEETARILKANYPQLNITQDEKGNLMFQSTIDGQWYGYKPGGRVSDIPRAAFAGAAFTPAGRASSIVGSGLAAAGTQAAIEASQAATGGEFDVKPILGAGAAGVAVPAAIQAVQAARQPAQQAIQAVTSRIPGRQPAAAVDTQSIGAAKTAPDYERVVRAEQLPSPVELTKGQATRDFAQMQFEREQAKMQLGAPLRERYAEQNEAILRNFDAWTEMTGAEAPSLREVGKSVDKALVQQAKKAKTEVRARYKKAEKAGEMEAPVSIQSVVDELNKSVAAESTAPVLTAAKKELQRLGGASIDDAGNLVASETGLTLNDAEQLRKFINKTTGSDLTNIKFAGDLKRAIDQATEGKGGQLYQAARTARMKYAQKFENRAIVNKLLRTKRGSDDRAVAYEDVFKHSILSGSLDDVKHLKRTLTGDISSETGRQAWKDLQGQTIEWIKQQATKNVQRDIRGNEIVSAAGLDKAIKSLDIDGKLDYLFGKRGAAQLRDLNELSKDVFTSPPGSVNASNTASALQVAIDAVTTGTLTGVPVPIATALREASKLMKNRKTAARINEALTYKGR